MTPRKVKDKMAFHNRIPDPTPEEIRKRCLEIQRGWSEHTRYSRLTKSQSRKLTFSARDCGKYYMEEQGYAGA
jgi:hypothetical protein